MTIVVLDNDLEMIDMAVKFEHGEPWHPEVKAIFNADTRTRAITSPATSAASSGSSSASATSGAACALVVPRLQ